MADKKIFCPHCTSLLSRKAYATHKRLYYDGQTDQWVKKQKLADEAVLRESEEAMEAYDFEAFHSQPSIVTSDTELHPPSPITFDMSSASGKEVIIDDQNSEEIHNTDDTLLGRNSDQDEVDTDVTIEFWDEDEDELDLFLEETGPNVAKETTDGSILLRWLLLFVYQLQIKHFIPDSAIDALLKFIFVLFEVLGKFSAQVKEITVSMPRTMYSFRQYFGTTSFKRLVVCTKCDTVRPYEQCIARMGVSKLCDSQEFPRSLRCKALLLKTVELASKKRLLYPMKVYCYVGIKETIKKLFGLPKFGMLCEQWRSMPFSKDAMCDIYDGCIWKEFQVIDGKSFLASQYNLGLSMNIDWFQPFKLTQYSVGVIYFTILNLPRSVRNNRQYVMLAGVIPGPEEPKIDINSYLKPVVEELQQLWSGISVKLFSKPTSLKIRAALLCVACDMPASRKVGGFLGHSANLGCSKCYKVFKGGFGPKDYSGFDRTLWNPRSSQSHRESIAKVIKCTSKTQRQQEESKQGCRYSVLLDLPYFDPIRMVVIDPMHNLFLGSAKFVTKQLFLDKNILDNSDLQSMQSIVDNFHVPVECGRIPQKIVSKFSGFTASQFKNWVNLFSIPCLYGRVSSEHLECWRSFVLACRLLCNPSLTRSNIILADLLLIKFCSKIELLFGPNAITPNMHMHGHLKGDIENFGPLHGFWLFAYERFNGVLGSYPNNNKQIEPQLTKKFLDERILFLSSLPSMYIDSFKGLMPIDISKLDDIAESDYIQVGNRYTLGTLADWETTALMKILSNILNCSESTIGIHSCYKKYATIQWKSKQLSSVLNKASHNNVLIAKWATDIYDQPPSMLPAPHHPDEHLRPVQVHCFAEIVYYVKDEEDTHTYLFAIVSWFSPHNDRYKLGKPAEVWCHSLFETTGTHTFLPYILISSRCAHAISQVKGSKENALIAVSIVE